MTRPLPAVALLLLTACQLAPAHADGLPDSLPPDPARPGWRPPAARAYQPAVGAAFDFEPGRGPLVDPHAEDRIWLVTPGAWGAATGPVSLPPPLVVAPPGCRPAPAAVPGPAGVAVAAGAFTFSRKLRKRIHV